MRVNSLALAVLLLASALGVGCRYQETDENWTGAEFTADGIRLEVGAEPPLCSCGTLTNATSGPLTLRASFRGVARGEATLAAGQALRFGYDWAGDDIEDVYVVEGYNANGQRVNLREATRLSAPEGWMPCNGLTCPFGNLAMNLPLSQQH